MQARRWPEALVELQAALDIDTKLIATSAAANPAYVQSTGSYRTSMGRSRLALGEIAQAQADAHTAREQLEAVARLDPDDAVSIQDLIHIYELEGDLCEQQSEMLQARRWFERAQAEMSAHADMRISASDQEDWNILRDKLAARTKLGASSVPMH